MTVSTIKMTAEQYLQLGQDPPGVRLELVDGAVAVSPSITPDHSFTDTRLRRILDEYVEANDLGRIYGDVDTIFGPHDVCRPDILYFRKDRLHLVGRRAMQGPPDLAVEIISPSSVKIDRKDKFKQYADGGIAYYWIVDTTPRTIEAFRLAKGRYLPCGDGRGDDVVHLPPFEPLAIPLARIWHPSH